MAEWGGISMGWGGDLVAGGGGGGGGGGPGPIVTNFDPPKDTPIYPATPISFDLLTDNDLSAVVVWIDYHDTGALEVAYSGTQGFGSNYTPFGAFIGSERQVITGGWHFILRRRGGWFASPTIRVEGADEFGSAIVEEDA